MEKILTIQSLDDLHRAASGGIRVYPISYGGSYRREQSTYSGLDDLADLYRRVLAKRIKPEAEYGPLYHCILKDALVVGQGTVISESGTTVRDSCWKFFNQGLTPPGASKVADDRFSLTSTSSRRIDEPTLLLKRPWWTNYGHWLVDAAAWLPMATCVNGGPDLHNATGLFETPAIANISEETLRLLSLSVTTKQLKHEDVDVWLCTDLHYLSPCQRSPQPKYPPSVAMLEAYLLLDFLISHSEEKLYIEKADPYGRTSANEGDVIALAVSRGFNILQPGDRSVQDQAPACRSASAILGANGAALTTPCSARREPWSASCHRATGRTHSSGLSRPPQACRMSSFRPSHLLKSRASENRDRPRRSRSHFGRPSCPPMMFRFGVEVENR